ncbi:MAG: hypothetical protein WCJ01_00975 [Ignavibacteria bacterium]
MIRYTSTKQLKKYQNMRSGIEGKFGQSKNFYGLNQIAARLEQTSISRHINEIILFQQTLIILL